MAQIEPDSELPYSNIPINDEAMENFLGTRLYSAVRSGELSSMRVVVSEGNDEDPLA